MNMLVRAEITTLQVNQHQENIILIINCNYHMKETFHEKRWPQFPDSFYQMHTHYTWAESYFTQWNEKYNFHKPANKMFTYTKQPLNNKFLHKNYKHLFWFGRALALHSGRQAGSRRYWCHYDCIAVNWQNSRKNCLCKSFFHFWSYLRC